MQLRAEISTVSKTAHMRLEEWLAHAHMYSPWQPMHSHPSTSSESPDQVAAIEWTSIDSQYHTEVWIRGTDTFTHQLQLQLHMYICLKI